MAIMVNSLIFQVILINVNILVIKSEPMIQTKSKLRETQEIGNFETCDMKLNFSNMDLNFINPNFISSSHIKNIILKNNNIQYFSLDTFAGLPNLEHLDVSNNKLNLSHLFSFGEIPSLKSLILDDNYFDSHSSTEGSDFQVSYYTYSELKYLSLRNVHLSPNVVQSGWKNNFPKLEYLDLSNNYLMWAFNDLFENLPSTISTLILENVNLYDGLKSTQITNISFLNLNNNRFSVVNSQPFSSLGNVLCLENFNNLKTLLISNCNIEEIEVDAFKDAQKLEYLDISNNIFSNLPEGIFNFTPRLSKLDISRNSISELPNDISRLKNLNTIIMDEMKNKEFFQSFEFFTQTSNIEIVSLRSNGLTSISQYTLNNLPNLRELDLSDNKIQFLLLWKWQKNLQKLVLNNNEVKNIEDLSLQEAKSLELLELEHNFVKIIKLTTLKHFSENVLVKF